MYVFMYAQCSFIEERKKNSKFSATEYLYSVIEHKPNCFKSHFASPQVSKLFHVFLTEKRNSFPL